MLLIAGYQRLPEESVRQQKRRRQKERVTTREVTGKDSSSLNIIEAGGVNEWMPCIIFGFNRKSDAATTEKIKIKKRSRKYRHSLLSNSSAECGTVFRIP
jgi:hypothetical protein